MEDLRISAALRLGTAVEAWNAAAENWDPHALTEIYTDDAVLFGGLTEHSVGKSQILRYFAFYVGEILSAKLTMHDVEILRTGSAAILVQGYCRFNFVLSGGKETTSDLRATWLIDWTDGATRIRAHHFSPPPSAPPLGNP